MNTPSSITINGITLCAPRAPRQNEVLTADALTFLAVLHREFAPRIAGLESRVAATALEVSVDEVAAQSWHAMIEQHLAEPPSSIVVPRSLARGEGRMQCQGEALSAGLVDFGIYVHRTARRLLAEGRAPFVSLPSLESEEELQLWQDIFIYAEQLLQLPEGTVRAIHLTPRRHDAGGAADGGHEPAGESGRRHGALAGTAV